MIKILKKMNRLLDAKQKRRMVLIVFLMLIGGVLESLSISVVIPVIEVLLDPNAVETNKYFAFIYNLWYNILELTRRVQIRFIRHRRKTLHGVEFKRT